MGCFPYSLEQAYRAKRLDVLTDEEKVRTLWMYLVNKDLSVRKIKHQSLQHLSIKETITAKA